MKFESRHGHAAKGKRSSTYRSWECMKARCNNPKDPWYERYGGRGITVCDRWLSFENFFADMGPRPEGMSLDRKDNDKGYGPDNCRWATLREQSVNRSQTVWLEWDGLRLHLADWSRRQGIASATIALRLRAGWPVEKALTRPVRKKG